MAAGIKLTNLNSRLSGPQEKAVKGGKQAAGYLTGPTRTARNFQQPNPLVSEFLNNNPKQESFYQMFSGPEAEQAQFEIDNRVVDPRNLVQLHSNPATEGTGVQDPNVAGKFPSNSVQV